jgi:hypothetical protein
MVQVQSSWSVAMILEFFVSGADDLAKNWFCSEVEGLLVVAVALVGESSKSRPRA